LDCPVVRVANNKRLTWFSRRSTDQTNRIEFCWRRFMPRCKSQETRGQISRFFLLEWRFSGVGKTYARLDGGILRIMFWQGMGHGTCVVGLVELGAFCMSRPDNWQCPGLGGADPPCQTICLCANVSRTMSRQYRCDEFDPRAALVGPMVACRSLILVDELAHTNIEGSIANPIVLYRFLFVVWQCDA